MRRLLTASVAALAGAALLGSTAPAASNVLTLEYTSGGVLLVSTGDGTTIRTSAAPGAVVPPGPYQVIVNNDMPDSRDIQHAFRFQGPGVNLQTDMAAGDNKTELYDVVLSPGSTYTFADDRQPNVSHVVVSTASSAAAVTSPTATTPAGSSSGTTSNTPVVGSDLRKALPFRGTLTGTVSTGGRLTLTAGGSPVLKLVAGRYKVVVSDKTARAGFTVQWSDNAPIALTGRTFVGKRSVTLSFRVGEWAFYAPAGTKHAFTVVK